ncbi:MAG: DUF192 domain-containing protein [Alphaproteobacteria bacterium]|nr:DUF192 domain-containing protein [Alphaproteobacteria bacterium]
MYRLLICLASLIVFTLGASVVHAEDQGALYPLQIITQQGTVRYTVEVARSVQEQKLGLMFRESLPPDHGMVFLHAQPQVLQMWMKSTLIGLDMIFIDQFGTVRHIHEGAKPHDETVISSVHAVVAVLEVNASVVRRDGISVGDIVTMGPRL